MKKIIVAICFLISLQSFAQDSVKISVSIQARDLEYISGGLLRHEAHENLWDSVKAKWRSVPEQSQPSGATNVAVTGYTIDWYNMFSQLKGDQVAGDGADRIEAALRAVGQTYLTGLLDALVTMATDLHWQDKG